METVNYRVRNINLIPMFEKETDMKILIVDDTKIITNRLRKLISRNTDEKNDSIEIIDQFDNLLMDIYKKSPNIILINTYSLRGTLVETIRAVKTIRPYTRIVCLTEFYDLTFGKILKDAGADYFIDVASVVEELPEILNGLTKQFN